jgi:hypothetical protein
VQAIHNPKETGGHGSVPLPRDRPTFNHHVLIVHDQFGHKMLNNKKKDLQVASVVKSS